MNMCIMNVYCICTCNRKYIKTTALITTIFFNVPYLILQIQEYNEKKNKREMAFEEELKKQKILKEKEIAKIQASQKASQDLQAAKDELNALRTQDKVI